MQRRLKLMAIAGKPATTAQISAAYATMADGEYPDDCWQSLLELSKAAVGVEVECLNCKNGSVSTRASDGFARIDCPVCEGTNKRRIHKPAPGELPGNISAAMVNKTLMQQVAQVLNGIIC